MGRSVSTPTNALLTCYRTLDPVLTATCDVCDADHSCYASDVAQHDSLQHCCGPALDYAHDEEDSWLEWENLIEDLIETCTSHWPSFYKIDEWLDREDHAWLENGLVKVGVSEYCGLVAIWIVPQEGQESLAERWVNQINDQFVKYFGQLQPVATASNGETFYQQLEH